MNDDEAAIRDVLEQRAEATRDGREEAPPVSADQDNVRCLRSIGVQPLLRIQFGLKPDSDSSGSVLYQGSPGPIPLTLLKVTDLRRGAGGRPSEFETQWA